jgi:hypothetical protein
MRAHAMLTRDISDAQRGWVIAEDLRSHQRKRLLRKGQRLDDEALAALADAEHRIVHVIELEAGDLHEDEAGCRIAAAVSGGGIRVRGPVRSRYNLVADRKGLLRIDAEQVRAINEIEGVTVFTLLDRQTVLPGKIVAGVKITPIAIAEANVRAVEELIKTTAQPVLRVDAFEPRRVAVVATERLNERMRERFADMVQDKMGWYGSEVISVEFVDATPEAVANAFERAKRNGAEVLMAAGGNTIDPLDPIFLALPLIGAEMVHFGAPAHPGSMFWLARAGETPIFNLASCSMYSQATVADLILPLVMTGQRVTSADVAELGYGGLLEREMRFRFPDYSAESSDEEHEE